MLCLNFLSLILPTSTEIHIAFREYQISCYNEIIQESREITQIGNFYCQRYKKEYPNYEQAKGLLPAWTIYEMFESYTRAKITNMRGREKKKKMLDEKGECPGEKMLFHQFEWEEIFCCSMTVNFVNTLRTFYLIN